MVLTREQIIGFRGHGTHEHCWQCDLRDTALAYHDLREATNQHALDLLGRVHSAEQKQARAEETLSFVRVERDNADADVERLTHEVERLTHERDAYRKAKAENDERFMLERDAARAEVERLRASLALQAESVENAAAEVARRCEGGSMTADPRVEAVAEALRRRYRADEPFTPAALAPIAVAALDAYDGPKFSSVVHECCERPTEADLRERIAQEIESKCRYMNHENRRLCQRCTAAARIARGES